MHNLNSSEVEMLDFIGFVFLVYIVGEVERNTTSSVKNEKENIYNYRSDYTSSLKNSKNQQQSDIGNTTTGRIVRKKRVGWWMPKWLGQTTGSIATTVLNCTGRLFSVFVSFADQSAHIFLM